MNGPFELIYEKQRPNRIIFSLPCNFGVEFKFINECLNWANIVWVLWG